MNECFYTLLLRQLYTEIQDREQFIAILIEKNN